MPDTLAQNLREEASLIHHSAGMYRQSFARLVEELNGDGGVAAERRGVRMCVEAVNLLLDSQERLAKTLLEAARAAA